MHTDKNSNSARRSPLGRLLRGLRISFLALLVLIVIGEVAVRLLTETRRPMLTIDARIGRRYVPGFEGRVLHPESQRKVHLRFNSEGLRFPDLPREKPAGTRRLLLIGDSMIAALEVEEEETTVVLLEQLYRAATIINGEKYHK